MNDDQAMTNTQAWEAQMAYHEGRAEQEQRLASDAQTEAARTAHLLLSARHRELAASAERVTDMPDAELPGSSTLRQAGTIMRESYGDLGQAQ